MRASLRRPKLRATAALTLFAVAALPAVGAAPQDSLAGTEAQVLPNGVRLVVRQRSGLPLVAIDVWVQAGSGDELAGEESAAHFLEHLVFKGTPTRGPGEIDGAIEDMGALLNAGTTRDAAHFFTTVASEDFNDALSVIADAICNASLDAREMERERHVILDEMARAASDPVHVATSRLFAELFTGDPYGRPVLGRPASIRAIRRENVLAFHRRCYTPARTTVVLAGNLTMEEAIRAARGAFGTWIPAEASATPAFQALLPSDARPGASAGDWARDTVAVGFRLGRAATALEIAFGSALVAILRADVRYRLRPEDRSRLRPGDPAVEFVPLRRDAVVTVVAKGGSARAIADAVDASVAQLRRAVSRADLDEAVRDALGRRVYDLETVAGQARMLGLYDRTLGDWRGAAGVADDLRSATPDQLAPFAALLFDPTRRASASAGASGARK